LKVGHRPDIVVVNRWMIIGKKKAHTERKARLTRTMAPRFRDDFALTEPFNMSKSVASIPTSVCQDWVAEKSGLVFRQMLYIPHDQLRRTNRSEGAYELDKRGHIKGWPTTLWYISYLGEVCLAKRETSFDSQPSICSVTPSFCSCTAPSAVPRNSSRLTSSIPTLSTASRDVSSEYRG